MRFAAFLDLVGLVGCFFPIFPALVRGSFLNFSPSPGHLPLFFEFLGIPYFTL